MTVPSSLVVMVPEGGRDDGNNQVKLAQEEGAHWSTVNIKEVNITWKSLSGVRNCRAIFKPLRQLSTPSFLHRTPLKFS